MDGRRPRLRLGMGLVPILFLLIFFFYPLYAILEFSFVMDGELQLSGFEDLLERDIYRETLQFTVWQAFLSTAITLILALPGAHVFARYQFPGKSILLALATVPFVLPTVVVAAAFRALLGEGSTLNVLLARLNLPPLELQETLELILIAHVFYNYAIALRIISSFWSNQNQRTAEAAMVLGANPLKVFWRVTLPMLMPAIAAAAALVFIFTFTSFGVVLLLGGFDHATLEVEIYRQSTQIFELPVAAALSVVQLMATFAMMVVYTTVQRRSSQPNRLQASRAVTRPKSMGGWLWVGSNLLLLSVLIFAPIAALIERSLSFGRDEPSLRYYELLSENQRETRLFVPPLEAVQNSLEFAAVTTVLAIILGTMAAYLLIRRGRWARILDPIFMLPLATSAVTLGFGYTVVFNQPNLPESILEWRTSFWLVPILHTLVAMPFVVRSVLPALRSIQPSMQEAAAVLGANPIVRWWRIELRLIARSILVGATFAFTISMGEFGASVFVVRPQEPTLPIAIERLLNVSSITNYGQALALSVVLMAVCVSGFLLIERLNAAVIGEF